MSWWLTFRSSVQCHVHVFSGTPQTVVGFHRHTLEISLPLKAVGGQELNLLPLHDTTWSLLLDYVSIDAVGAAHFWKRLQTANQHIIWNTINWICSSHALYRNQQSNICRVCELIIFKNSPKIRAMFWSCRKNIRVERWRCYGFINIWESVNLCKGRDKNHVLVYCYLDCFVVQSRPSRSSRSSSQCGWRVCSSPEPHKPGTCLEPESPLTVPTLDYWAAFNETKWSNKGKDHGARAQP